MKYFSPSTRGFYDPDIHGPRTIQVEDGNNPGNTITMPNPDTLIPADAVEITDEMHQELLQGQRQGKTITFENGMPVAVLNAMTVEGMREMVFPEMRRLREVILNRLTGIGLAALASGDAGLMAEIAALRQKLLDLTKHPDVLAVTPEQGPAHLREVALNVYRAEAALASETVRLAFKEIQL